MPFLQSLSNLFTGNSSNVARYNNRRTAMDTTLDAFSLPTTAQRYGTAYGDGPHLDSASSSPGPSRRGSTVAYTSSYPPRDDVPGTTLPNSYPPLTHTFHRLRVSLSNSFPELLETLNPPVDLAILQTFESELGCPLPRAVRESLAVIDGQDLEATDSVSGSGGLFYGLHFLSLEEVMREWAFWRQAELDPSSSSPAVLATMASVPPAWIKTVYTSKGWVPLLSDRAGNYVGIDLDPGPNGAWGQVIVFGRDFDRKCVLWRGDGEGGWGKWLATFVDQLESGEGWEADKVSSSDEDEDVGYANYNGQSSYGEAGSGLRLAGEYRGWNVLEAWWDLSVRQWETVGMGLDIQEVERGLEEARRLTGMSSPISSTGSGKGKGKAVETLSVNTARTRSPVQDNLSGSPQFPPQPGTPVPRDSDVLLPPASPEQLPIPKIRHPAPSPVRVITPVSSVNDHPLKEAQAQGPPSTISSAMKTTSRGSYLSPPTNSPRRRKPPPPAPSPIDLPTRADIQAMSAIATAEVTGLRGGWVMNLDSVPASRLSRLSLSGSSSGMGSRGRPSVDEMVDIDLEGGKQERFGSPMMSPRDEARQHEDERLSHLPLEHRSPVLAQHSRTPSPLSRSASPLSINSEPHQKTPKAAARIPSPVPSKSGSYPLSLAAGAAIIRPPPIAASSSASLSRGLSDDGSERDRSTIRGFVRPSLGPGSNSVSGQREREASVMSTDSHDGLLGRSASPVLGDKENGLMDSPTTVATSSSDVGYAREGRKGTRDSDFQEVAL